MKGWVKIIDPADVVHLIPLHLIREVIDYEDIREIYIEGRHRTLETEMKLCDIQAEMWRAGHDR